MLTNFKNIEKKFKEEYKKKCDFEYIPAVLPATKRIIILGDIHGDFDLCINLLTMTKIIDDKLNWIGGDSHVVQVGDQIDSCRPINGESCENIKSMLIDKPDDIKILYFCSALHEQAKKYKGAFISLLGNHEIMNSLGDIRYVSPNNLKLEGKDKRIDDFKSGNKHGIFLGCTRMACVIIGSYLFIHAGIIDEIITELGINNKKDLNTLNMAIKLWLLGGLIKSKTKQIKKILTSPKSIFWIRELGIIPPNTNLRDHICSNNVGKTLDVLEINGIVIGHTPQSSYGHGTNSTCGGKIWRVDNGSSFAFSGFKNAKFNNNRKPQALEILNDNEFYLYTNGEKNKI